MTFINNTAKKSTNKILGDNKTDNELKELTDVYIKKISKKYKIYPKKIYYRKMKTKWASCSNNKNITINTLLRYLPEKNIQYVLYHELTHIKEKKHNKRFWGIVSKEFPNYKKMENDLFTYWFLTQQKLD